MQRCIRTHGTTAFPVRYGRLPLAFKYRCIKQKRNQPDRDYACLVFRWQGKARGDDELSVEVAASPQGLRLVPKLLALRRILWKMLPRKTRKRLRRHGKRLRKVVFTSCSGCFQSQCALVKNADAPCCTRFRFRPYRFCRGRRWNAAPTGMPKSRAQRGRRTIPTSSCGSGRCRRP